MLGTEPLYRHFNSSAKQAKKTSDACQTDCCVIINPIIKCFFKKNTFHKILLPHVLMKETSKEGNIHLQFCLEAMAKIAFQDYQTKQHKLCIFQKIMKMPCDTFYYLHLSVTTSFICLLWLDRNKMQSEKTSHGLVSTVSGLVYAHLISSNL